MGRIITIPYKPRIYFKSIHDCGKRYIVIVAHRRSGKTTFTLNHLQRSALTIPNSRYAFISPTYKMSKNVAWDIIKYYSKVVPGVNYNESELTVKYPNGSKITLYGSDNPDSLRGIGLWGVVFDEYSQQPSNIFTEIIRPALTDHEGYAIWIGTPKGKNEFYKLYEFGKKNNDWLSLLLTIKDTGILPKEEIENARKTMSEDEFEQEFYCSFESTIKGAIYAGELYELRKSGRIKPIAYDKECKVHTAWDLGAGHNLAIGFYQKVGTEIHMIDYWEGERESGIAEGIIEVKKKPYIFGVHIAPHDIRAVELSTGKSRKDFALSMGIDFEVAPELGVDEGIDIARRCFPRLWIDSFHCELFVEKISQYRWEWLEEKGIFKKKPCHDFTSHAADQFRYMAVSEDKMTNDIYKKFTQEPYVPFTKFGL